MLSIYPKAELPSQDFWDVQPDGGGETLAQLSEQGPVLLVLLRHAGCVFAREAMSDLCDRLPELERQGICVAIVHQSRPERTSSLTREYNLEEIPHFSDPDRTLYGRMGLEQLSSLQLVRPSLLRRGFQCAIHHSPGRIEGDGFQMPGIFVLYRGRVLEEYKFLYPEERPDYKLLGEMAARRAKEEVFV